jgi:hypothetical protein
MLTRHTGGKVLRGGKALLSKGDYEKTMVESLDRIKTRSSSLMEEAAKSHIHEFHMCTHASGPPEASITDTCPLLSKTPKRRKSSAGSSCK